MLILCVLNIFYQNLKLILLLLRNSGFCQCNLVLEVNWAYLIQSVPTHHIACLPSKTSPQMNARLHLALFSVQSFFLMYKILSCL